MVADKKGYKKFVHAKELKTITGPKLYCNTKYWRQGKVMWMAKRQRQATAKYIQFDAWVRTGNPKRCNAKTDHG